MIINRNGEYMIIIYDIIKKIMNAIRKIVITPLPRSMLFACGKNVNFGKKCDIT